jgi:hypothetical protein
MKKLAGALIALALVGCDDGILLQTNPVEIVEVAVPFPVPGDTEYVDRYVPVVDTALVKALLRIIGDVESLECVVPHEHHHREDVCGILANGLRDLP